MHLYYHSSSKKNKIDRYISSLFSKSQNKIIQLFGILFLVITLPLILLAIRNKQSLIQHASVTVSPLLFGTNLGLFNSSDTFLTTPVQNLVTQMHVQIIRMPIRNGTPDSIELQAAQVIKNLGMTPLVILSLSSANPVSDGTNTIQAMNNIFGSSLVYYELGNEQFDSSYTGKWNQIIPQLVSIPINGRFIGPVAAENFGSTETSNMANFYVNATPKPYALSWHEYSCGNADSATTCLDHIDTAPGHNWGQHWNDTLAALQKLGVQTMPPVFITEWNYDAVPPANDPRDTPQFQTQFVQRAIQQLAKEGVTAAMQYDLNTNSFYNLVTGNSLTAAGQEFQQMYTQLIGNNGGVSNTPTPIPQTTVTNPPTATPEPTPPPVATDTPTSIPCNSPTPQISGTISTTPTPTLGPTTGSISLHFEGIDPQNNAKPHHPQRVLIISFYSSQDFTKTPVTSFSINVTFDQSDPNGAFTNTNIDLSTIPPGNYYILAKSPEGSLQELISAQPVTIVAGQNNSLTGSTQSNPNSIAPLMRMGDLNNDNTVDLTDYNILVDCYEIKSTSPACKGHNLSDQTKGLFADIDDDGSIDGVDYNILIRNYGANGYGIVTQTMNAIEETPNHILKSTHFDVSPCTTPTDTPTLTNYPSPQPSSQPTPTITSVPGTLSIQVQGNKFVDATGQTIQLRGVDRSGTEYMCVKGPNIFDGPSDVTSVQAIQAWHAHIIRIPLNEDCWLGINGVGVGGTTYQQAIVNFVNLINQNNLYVILDLHWNAPGTALATAQQDMADSDHAITFWTSVANTFKNNPAVIFDLYNEPHSIPWSCWKSGGNCGGSFPIAGMQQMVDAVRGTGATNVIIAGGLQWANDLTGWLANEPNDPLHNIAASWHIYNNNQCNNSSCFVSQLAPVAAQVPIIAGEMGEYDCASTFITSVMSWLDSHGISYLGWSWNVASCGGFPSLITDYSGTPTNFGIGLKNHLLTFP